MLASIPSLRPDFPPLSSRVGGVRELCDICFLLHLEFAFSFWRLFEQYETMNVLCLCGFTSEASFSCCKSSALGICMSNFW